MKRKFVSRAIPSAIVAGGLLVAGAMSATAADDGTPKVEQSQGGLGGLLTGTVDAVVGDDGVVDTTLTQVTDTVGQVTKKGGAVDDTVTGVTGVVDSVAGQDGAVDDVVTGVTGARGEASTPAVKSGDAKAGGPVEDVVGGVTGAVTALAGENGAVDDVLGADGPEQGVTDNLPSEIIDDVGSIGENLGGGDVPGAIGGVGGDGGLVDDLLESPTYADNPGGGDPGDPGDGGDGGAGDDGDDGAGIVPIGNGTTPGGVDPLAPIGADGEAQAPGALAQTGGQAAGAAAVALGLTAAGAAMIRARRRILEVTD
ncbi:hypothetical protein ACFQHV_20595 [Promicromonospora thailandica]|uniref:LPXTG-motif cell wall-anchored protein n=1 Tax=Promicromonospora thailandica TaxID=765201 RepID=A0A9X2JVJ1_9MICO|nr:hypothetical protein [Promicromonospora thailandica]MCP2264168.1 hypothetical protein [Promicromonospora thailandica]BFF21164.1 hypothetical protein GCM10025730_46850 [Promicromonospora thailandica]